MNFAWELWLRIETLHTVTYFGAETEAASHAAGMTGFWMGYFGFRAAPMGPVGCGTIEGAFFNFAPSFVARWVPEVWERTTPEALIAARSAAAARTLERLAPAIGADATAANRELAPAVDRCVGAGRPLFAANRNLALPDDPVEALWQLCTTLREHRGDGHVAALTAAGLDGIEAHVLIALDQGRDGEDLQRTRGWTAVDWSNAVERCRARGLVDRAGRLTDAGREIRRAVEATTDRLATDPWNLVADRDRDRLLEALSPAAEAVSASGVIRYPNPIGLPPIA